MSARVICVFFLVCVCVIECQETSQTLHLIPRCETCKYTYGHSFSSHDNCGTYIHCSWDPKQPDFFQQEMICCNNGKVFDEQKFPPGCYFQDRPMDCNPVRFRECPRPAPSRCPFREDRAGNASVYEVQEFGEWKVRSCGDGTIFDPVICACIFPPPDIESCGLLIDFDFDLNVMSEECGQRVVGHIFGKVFMVQGFICFSGYEQFFEIAKLMEWFETSNKKEFTVSFWFNFEVDDDYAVAGLFSTNCVWRIHGSPVELLIVDNELAVVLGRQTYWSSTKEEIEPREWYHVAVTYDHGLYIVYLNGHPVYEKITDYDLVCTHTHATLGYVEQDLFFRGCMDDFLFYTDALDADQLYAHYSDRTIRNFREL